MSNSRKIFGFLKFIEDLKKFYSYLYDSSFNTLTILKAFTCLSASFYHFLDNLVWASNVGMINRIITGELRWKTPKNLFSLIRTGIKLATDLIDFKCCYYSSWINNENEVINEDYTKILEETIKNRSKLRMKSLTIIRSLLKMITLLYSLKFTPVIKYIPPIIIALCGVIYSCISVLKSYLSTSDNQKKMLINIKKSNEHIDELQFRRSETPRGGSLIIQTGRRKTQRSFELTLIDRKPNHRILTDEHYFENYYLDFNKDFPIVPELVLKANGGIFQDVN
jgi:hypothetical protein